MAAEGLARGEGCEGNMAASTRPRRDGRGRLDRPTMGARGAMLQRGRGAMAAEGMLTLSMKDLSSSASTRPRRDGRGRLRIINEYRNNRMLQRGRGAMAAEGDDSRA